MDKLSWSAGVQLGAVWQFLRKYGQVDLFALHGTYGIKETQGSSEKVAYH